MPPSSETKFYQKDFTRDRQQPLICRNRREKPQYLYNHSLAGIAHKSNLLTCPAQLSPDISQ
ncbi:hypothetical protein AVDCRST_MAG84-5863 [uncultured Microcoleus sp.]|uniref:Uncharacterized protein n=1 Tax=uncultured Microcoleus sp. TaxID=259945 RepID=A0A6J4NRV5_9CYAN|nr:hypothetical protein AVDCRST_MAG84-5863 [uncultured Microcoleus sp.]